MFSAITERQSANGREGALCSLCFRYSRRRRVKVWNEVEGVVDTQVLATHEEQSGQPA